MVLFSPTANAPVIDLSNIQNSFIFLANKISEGEVFNRQLFGLPSDRNNYLEKLSDVLPGKSLLFMFNMTTRVLHGIFVPTCPASAYIEPSAWRGKFPVQIRFSLYYGPLMLSERFFPDFLGCEYNKCRKLDKKQTEQLVTAFLTVGSVFPPPVPEGWTSVQPPRQQRPFFRGNNRPWVPRRAQPRFSPNSFAARPGLVQGVHKGKLAGPTTPHIAAANATPRPPAGVVKNAAPSSVAPNVAGSSTTPQPRPTDHKTEKENQPETKNDESVGKEKPIGPPHKTPLQKKDRNTTPDPVRIAGTSATSSTTEGSASSSPAFKQAAAKEGLAEYLRRKARKVRSNRIPETAVR